jgi:uncharacterized membrane protein YsdA (DUF1294 family)
MSVEAAPNPSPKASGKFGFAHLGVFAVLLVAPGIAVYRGLGPTVSVYVAGWFTAISVLTFVVLWRDKHQAKTQEWRSPEALLHLLELFGGWPGGFLAQRWFRHKTAKISYQFVFWLIVLLYQAVAIDWLLGWRLLHAAIGSATQG